MIDQRRIGLAYNRDTRPSLGPRTHLIRGGALLKFVPILVVASVFGVGASEAAMCPALPVTLTNGSTADATLVMSDFNTLLDCANTSLAPLHSPLFTGNVGIGTTTPNSSLQLVWSGTGLARLARFQNSSSPTAGVDLGSLASGGYVEALGGPLGFVTSSIQRMTIDSSGNIGIGTQAPAYRLTVLSPNQQVSVALALDTPAINEQATMVFRSNGSNKWSLGKQTSDDFFLYDIGAARNDIQIATGGDLSLMPVAGNVGIGVTSAAVKLAVLGDIRTGTSGTNGCIQNYAGTAIAGTCSSDSRLKTIVGSVLNVLKGFAQLRLVKFKWNNRAEQVYQNSTSATNTGFIAQTVAHAFPELVSTDRHGYEQVDYTGLQLYGLQAISELKRANDTQSKQIKTLVSIVKAKSRKIDALEEKIDLLIARLPKRTSRVTGDAKS